jgi:hypothetical protein
LGKEKERLKGMKPTINFAKYYTSLGYVVTPIAEGTKNRYLQKWSQEQVRTFEDCEQWFGSGNRFNNLAILTGERGNGLLVLDLDPGQTYLTLEKAEDLQNVYCVKTPSGGFHYYFKCPEGERFSNSAGLIAENVDIRSEGGLIIAPPSEVKNKGVYDWVDDSLDVPVKLLHLPPDWLLNDLRQVESRKGAKTINEVDVSAQVEEARKRVHNFTDEDSVFKKFNSRSDRFTMLQILQGNGWRLLQEMVDGGSNPFLFVARPDRNTGGGKIYDDHFFSFTGSAPPIQANKNYSPVDLLLAFDFNNDLRELAKFLEKEI